MESQELNLEPFDQKAMMLSLSHVAKLSFFVFLTKLRFVFALSCYTMNDLKIQLWNLLYLIYHDHYYHLLYPIYSLHLSMGT